MAPKWRVRAIALCALCASCNPSCARPRFLASAPTPIQTAPNPFWTIGTWFIDPANASGCASDTNDCQHNLCSGVQGPCLTWSQIYNTRWGCAGIGQSGCPLLAQNTTITYMSNTPSNGETDPIGFRPGIRNGAAVTIQGVLNAATQISTGTITVVQAKNRATGTPLSINVSGAPLDGEGDLVVNTTRSSQATVYASGTPPQGAWVIFQPLQGTTLLSSLPVEDDSWTTGNSYTAYRLAGANFVTLAPTIDDVITTSLLIKNMHFLNPGGEANNAVNIVSIDGPVQIADSIAEKKIVSHSEGYTPAARFVDTYFFFNGQVTGVPPTGAASGPALQGNGSAAISTVPSIFGGGFFDQPATFDTSFRNVWLDYDVELEKGGIGASFEGTNFYGCISVDGGVGHVFLYAGAYLFPTTLGACSAGAIVWQSQYSSPGLTTSTIFVNGASYWSYKGQDAGFTFKNMSFRISDQLTGCSHNSGQPDIVECGITLDVAHFDAPQGDAGCGGYCYIPGGGTFSNGL